MKIREYYVDLRFGWSAIAPVIGFANFIMLSYIAIKAYIPFEIIIPILTISLIISLTIIGTIFRKKQLSIDSTMNYEQQVEPARTGRIGFDNAHAIMEKLGIPIPEESINRRDYLYRIENGKA